MSSRTVEGDEISSNTNEFGIPSADQFQKESITLRQLASRTTRPLAIGTAVLPALLFNNNDKYDNETDDKDSNKYSETVKSEFNAIVIEHHLKWSPLCEALPGPHHDESACTRPGRYDFHYVDRMVDYAIQNKMQIKGHVLIWHVTSPSFLEGLNAVSLRKEMRRHIFTVMGRYKREIKIWDVVNEALAPDGSFADNIFYRTLGESYIEEAFHLAHEADPSAFLIYNDNKVEGIESPKSEAFYLLLKRLKEKNVPVHGAGMQAHFNAAGIGLNRVPSPKSVRNQIRRLGALGLKVNISEMDVRVSKLPSGIITTTNDGREMDIRNFAQRQIYRDILAVAFSEPAFDGVWFWGFTDKHSWVHQFYYNDEPLLFDHHYNKKESYYGVKEALETLTIGGVVGARVLMDDEDGITSLDKEWGNKWKQPEPEPEPEPEPKSKEEEKRGDDRPDWLQS